MEIFLVNSVQFFTDQIFLLYAVKERNNVSIMSHCKQGYHRSKNVVYFGCQKHLKFLVVRVGELLFHVFVHGQSFIERQQNICSNFSQFQYVIFTTSIQHSWDFFRFFAFAICDHEEKEKTLLFLILIWIIYHQMHVKRDSN